MDTNAQQQIRRAGDDLVTWVANYDAHGRTYRQFWMDYSIAAGAFEALTSRDDLIEGVMDLVCTVREFPILLGFEPEALIARPEIDDLIIGKQRCEGVAA